jgi:Ca2+/H+ antiporter, TMEM165/GDT1 family
VMITGALLRQPLTKVPENAMKFSVGVMLASFGIFWSAEGAGIQWPGADLAIGAILGFMLLVSLALVRLLRQRKSAVPA